MARVLLDGAAWPSLLSSSGLPTVRGSLSRCLLFGVAVAFPLSFRRMLGAFHADRRLAWFAILPFFSRALSIGFLPYLFSVPVGLMLVARLGTVRVMDGSSVIS